MTFAPIRFRIVKYEAIREHQHIHALKRSSSRQLFILRSEFTTELE